jgi:hypothetical protein
MSPAADGAAAGGRRFAPAAMMTGLLFAAMAASASGTIVSENALPGTPAAQWDVEGAGDPSIQGFATEASVNRGQTVEFKVRTDTAAFRLEIYRLGYYGGAGARRVAEVRSRAGGAQPECLTQPDTGLIDCGNWQVSAAWPVPREARSGVYIARLVREDTGGASHVMFVVRDDAGAADILLQTSDTTWQAYNDYGGNSLYVGAPAGRAYKVSYNRPMVLRGGKYRRASFWANEYPMIRWLEANGYEVAYISGVDTARDGNLLRGHRIFMSLGHDEYWAAEQRRNVEAARDAGVHLAFFSGNAVFWKTRWEPSIDDSRQSYRTLVTYKETHADAKIDPSGVATGTWRDPRFSLPGDGGRPENALKGSLFVANCCRFDSITVSAAQARNRFWRHTGLEALATQAPVSVGTGTVGYEWDADIDNGYRPAGLIRLSATTLPLTNALLDFGSRYGEATATHSLTLFRHSSGALVFSTGTILWSWGLDPVHDDPDAQAAPVDPRLQQATVNLLADMSVQPGSLREPLIAAAASEDTQAPVAVIASPADGHKSTFHLPVKVTGSAEDAGGVVAGVEISTDGGATWHPVAGTEQWSYEFVPRTRGAFTLLARAVDDSANLQPIPAVVTLQAIGFSGIARVAAPVLCVMFLLVAGLFWWGWRRRRLRRQSGTG